MIIPMLKYSFLVYHKEYQDFLKELQELGVVHVIEKSQDISDSLRERMQKIKRFEKAIKYLEKRPVDSHDKPLDKPGEEILNEIDQLQDKLEQLQQDKNIIRNEILNLEPWGDFSVEMFDKLKKVGVRLRFYTCPERKFNKEWSEKFHIEIINHIGSSLYFVVFFKEDEEPEIDAEEMRIPHKSVDEFGRQLKKKEQEEEEINNKLDQLAGTSLDQLRNEVLKLKEKLDFEKVKEQTDSEAEEKVMVLEGWNPKSNRKKLTEFLNQKGIVYVEQKPGRDEKPPVVLKNNWYARLFEPIGKLYSLPDYAELDLTPFFAPFFMLFFGFCLGDAGYGLLFILGASIYRLKAKKEHKPMISLIQILGAATVLFGIISGTFFGVNLLETEISWITDLKAFMLSPNQMFYFAIVLGAIQLIYGMVIKIMNITKQHGFKYSLSTLGWIMLIVSSALYLTLKGEDGGGQAILKYSYYTMLGVSGLLILFLNNPDKNIFANFGSGLGDIYFTTTGLLGDLLSYIRLFALGISSAILGYVFNFLAMEMSGDTIIVSQIVFALILLVGHAINIFMASLGAFVHPLRLTFVEFYKSAGFAGGGAKYKPFKKFTLDNN
jgi:V/A-type H+/Na+-transporting ATPase subunit I